VDNHRTHFFCPKCAAPYLAKQAADKAWRRELKARWKAEEKAAEAYRAAEVAARTRGPIPVPDFFAERQAAAERRRRASDAGCPEETAPGPFASYADFLDAIRGRSPTELLNALGLSAMPTSEADLKRAYWRKSLETHPDRGGNAADFRRVTEAFNTLRSRVAS
jgi:hypothetical protein